MMFVDHRNELVFLEVGRDAECFCTLLKLAVAECTQFFHAGVDHWLAFGGIYFMKVLLRKVFGDFTTVIWAIIGISSNLKASPHFLV